MVQDNCLAVILFSEKNSSTNSLDVSVSWGHLWNIKMFSTGMLSFIFSPTRKSSMPWSVILLQLETFSSLREARQDERPRAVRLLSDMGVLFSDRLVRVAHLSRRPDIPDKYIVWPQRSFPPSPTNLHHSLQSSLLNPTLKGILRCSVTRSHQHW